MVKKRKYSFVYRLEHSSRKLYDIDFVFCGPYGVSGIVYSSEWQSEAKSYATHPSPDNDQFKPKLPKVWEGRLVCGFSSLKGLKKWFTASERNKLRKLGFIIRVYKTTKAYKSKAQTLFEPQSLSIKSFDID